MAAARRSRIPFLLMVLASVALAPSASADHFGDDYITIAEGMLGPFMGAGACTPLLGVHDAFCVSGVRHVHAGYLEANSTGPLKVALLFYAGSPSNEAVHGFFDVHFEVDGVPFGEGYSFSNFPGQEPGGETTEYFEVHPDPAWIGPRDVSIVLTYKSGSMTGYAVGVGQ